MLPVLFILFVGSGCAALIYEIVWFQLLELVIGSSSVSIGVLLGTFMGGMCLGSLLLPRVVSPWHHPLRVYAALEAGIGICGLALLLLVPSVGRLYTAWGGGGVSGFLLRGALAALCLLPPTLAMGATLPAAARWVETTPQGIAWLGLFYAGNIAGAVGGSLLAGFYLLRVYDTAIATAAAAAINAAVAVLAMVLASRHHRAAGADVFTAGTPDPKPGILCATTGSSGPAGSSDWPVYLTIALSGFCALAGEVIWTRQLALLFGATVYTFSLILAVFLIGLGIGSVAGSVLSRAMPPRIGLGWCQLLIVAAVAWTAHELAVSLPFWPINPAISTSVWFNLKLDFVRALWAVLPPAILWGVSFPLALAAVSTRGRDGGRLVGGIYAANTIGAVGGALGASLLLVAWIGSQRTQQVMMVVSALAGLLVLATAGRRPRRVDGQAASVSARYGAAAAAALLIVFLITSVPPISGMLVAHGRFAATLLGQAGDIIYVGEGLQSSVAVSRLPTGKLGYHNAGKIQASSAPEDMRLQRMLGHLTTLVPRQPRSVLVIGCGAGVTAGAVSINPQVERVTIAEIEPLVPRVVSTYFSAQNYDVVGNPKVRIHIDDARHYLLTATEKFDAITSDPLDPWVKGAATLYTREFFQAARDHLNPGGVVTLFVQLYDSSPAAVKSEIATFFEVFPGGLIAGNTFRGVGYDTVLLGQVEPTRIDLDAIQARLDRPDFGRVAASLREIGLASAVDLFSTYAGRAIDLKPWLSDASINSDSNLRLQYLAGLGLNMNESDTVYAEILRYRRFPADVFTGSEARLAALKSRISPTR
ncbi:MAG: fused MFS/spermidine synthase [Acidobacteriota bacterium]